MLGYLATKPTGGVLTVLVIAVALFAVATVLAGMNRAFELALISAGLAFLVLAFVVS